MREGPLLQTLHFNSVLIDPNNNTGAVAINTKTTNWNDYFTRGKERASSSVPIVLPATAYTKNEIESSGKKAAALVDKDGKTWAILRTPEIYVNRKEEIVARCFGVIDPGHPYIEHIYNGGDYLIGGEIEMLEKVTYADGLDQWRRSPKQLFNEFKSKGADVVFAFQTRNPTHAGHAYLMRTGRERLLKMGYKNPVLLLSPLGGWTKFDDVPLDVRVKQHQAVLDEGMLDPSWTVMGIWPAPMIYAGPTEVQFHAASRRNCGASFFVVGRDAAGMKGSELAQWSPDDDLYNADHARYVLQMSPVLEDQEMKLISFDKFYYDKSDHQMKAMDPTRPDDFISISGSKMRALARQGATPCSDPIPSDLLGANCVPQVSASRAHARARTRAMLSDARRSVSRARRASWCRRAGRSCATTTRTSTRPTGCRGRRWCRRRPSPRARSSRASTARTASRCSSRTVASRSRRGTFACRRRRELPPLFEPRALTRLVVSRARRHDLPLRAAGGSDSYTFVVEIPMGATAKMECMKEHWYNPIQQDSNKDGSTRYYTYGVPFFNYGFLPQTWEDPSLMRNGFGGDNDPLDVMEIGSGPLAMGSVVSVKVLGSLELIDEGETDHKVIALRTDDPDASRIHDMASLEQVKPGITAKMVDWLKMYKTSDGKAENVLASDTPYSISEANAIIEECHERWQALKAGTAANPGFFLGY